MAEDENVDEIPPEEKFCPFSGKLCMTKSCAFWWGGRCGQLTRELTERAVTGLEASIDILRHCYDSNNDLLIVHDDTLDLLEARISRLERDGKRPGRSPAPRGRRGSGYPPPMVRPPRSPPPSLKLRPLKPSEE